MQHFGLIYFSIILLKILHQALCIQINAFYKIKILISKQFLDIRKLYKYYCSCKKDEKKQQFLDLCLIDNMKGCHLNFVSTFRLKGIIDLNLLFTII